MFRTIDDWFFHIKQIHQKRMELGLDRISQVACRLALTQFNCPVITVAGTNGKGSCVKTLEAIYVAAGYRTALYTSPHLLEFHERIRIANQNVDDAALIRAFSAIEAARQDVILSFFEFITLAALFLFQGAVCDVIILEVGLGGRLDAVNIVESDVTVVTSIALDHMDWLGDTRELIGYEKASIARAGKPLICGEENPPINVRETVLAKNAVLQQIGIDFNYHVDNTFHCFGKHFQYGQLPMPHLKPQNVAIAIAALETLQNRLPVSEKNIADGINHTLWPARFEMIETPLSCVFDVAHNPHAAEWLKIQYQQLPRAKNTIGIVGMLKDKAITETVHTLLSCVDTWFVCDLQAESEERGSDGKLIATYLQAQGVKNCYTFDSVDAAMLVLMQSHCQQECDRALIFGSFYTVAAAKRWLSRTYS